MIVKTLVSNKRGQILLELGDGHRLVLKEGGKMRVVHLKWLTPSNIKRIMDAGVPDLCPSASMFRSPG